MAKSRHIDPCFSCGAEMRPSGAPAEGWPGTVARRTQDTCYTCHRKDRQPRSPQEVELERNQISTAVLARLDMQEPRTAEYIRSRRTRGVPAEGWGLAA